MKIIQVKEISEIIDEIEKEIVSKGLEDDKNG